MLSIMLTDKELETSRSTQTESLDSLCTLKSKSVNFDELGDAISTFSETEISCAVKYEEGNKATFRFPYGSVIQAGDLIDIAGSEYEIESLIKTKTCIKAKAGLANE